MRIAIAAAFSLGLALAGTALAQATTTWTHPASHFSIAYPSNWDAGPMGAQGPTTTRHVFGLADAECQVLWLEHASSAALNVERLHEGSKTPLSTEVWFQASQGMGLVGPGGTVESITVDTDTAWPIHRATIRTADGAPVYAAIHQRPGQQVWVSCKSFDSRDRAATFSDVIRSTSFARDAEWAAAIDAARAQAAAPPPPPPPPPEEERRRRRN